MKDGRELAGAWERKFDQQSGEALVGQAAQVANANCVAAVTVTEFWMLNKQR